MLDINQEIQKNASHSNSYYNSTKTNLLRSLQTFFLYKSTVLIENEQLYHFQSFIQRKFEIMGISRIEVSAITLIWQ